MTPLDVRSPYRRRARGSPASRACGTSAAYLVLRTKIPLKVAVSAMSKGPIEPREVASGGFAAGAWDRSGGGAREEQPTNAEGRYPLVLMLARRPNPDLLELLLRYGADPNTRQPAKSPGHPYKGETLLQLSIGSLENVKVLVTYGANVNTRVVPSPRAGPSTAATNAAAVGRFDVVDYLVDHGLNELDEVVAGLLMRSWAAEVLPRRLKTLEKLRAHGAKIFAQHEGPPERPVMSWDVAGIPSDWITPGIYRWNREWDRELVTLPPR